MENLQTEYELTPDEQAMVNPLIEAVENMQKDAQAILRAITRMRNLQGQWNLQGTKLIKVGDAPGPQQLQPASVADHNGNG